MPSSTELLHQSLQASTQGQDALALALLHQAASQPDASAEVLFALGSEHVERGDEAQGQACFERALALNPGLPIARFQLGFLHALSGRAAQAEAVWAGFETQAPTHPQAGYLALLAQGLRAWQRGDMAQAAQGLRQGMAANFDNAPLNANMQKLLDRLQGVGAAPGAEASAGVGAGTSPVSAASAAASVAAAVHPTVAPAAAPTPEEQEAANVFLNAYTATPGQKPH